MKIYKVGGCVRDMLLGLTPKDVDYVVVGATPDEMEALGYEKVGASFPVFLKDGSEYALARTERKVGVGYLGFETSYDPNVTLEDDLKRRDLTINSMAFDDVTCKVIDPHGGRADLEAKLLRHTSEAFAEDPVRVLRTVRFAARYGFTIVPETLELMERIVPELDHVPAERIWTEIEKGLMEKHPHKMFAALFAVDAFSTNSMKPYSQAHLNKLELVTSNHDLVTRFMLVGSGFKDDDYINCRIPTECAVAASAFNQSFAQFALYMAIGADRRIELFQRLRAFNDRRLLNRCLEGFAFYDPDYAPHIQEAVEADLERLETVDAAVIAASCATGAEVKAKLFQARVDALDS
jgi:tRNA nucleotidyltransferase/poly(A) polymerase